MTEEKSSISNNISSASTINQLQNKVRVQAKRLCEQQEYISVLEHRLSLLNPNNKQMNNINNKNEFPNSECELYNLYNTLQKENQKIIKEKQNLMSQMQKEVINNDEQRNYIEILKQAIESSLIKNGLKIQIDNIKQKYYPNVPKDEYATVILDLSNIKTNNINLEKEKKILNKEIEISHKEIKEMKKLIDDNQKENIQLKDKIKIFENIEEKLRLTNNELIKKNKELEVLSQKNQQCLEEIRELKNKTNRVTQIEQENFETNKKFCDLQIQYEQLITELNRLSNIESNAISLSKENNEIYHINQNLINENNYLTQENSVIKNDLNKLEKSEEDNIKLNKEISNLRENLNLLQNEKNKNENIYLNKVQILIQEKNALESLLCKVESKHEIGINEIKNENDLYRSDNKKLYNKNKQLNQSNMKCTNENIFYTNLIYRLMKYHVNSINTKNIISQMLDLNQKLIQLQLEAHNYEKTFKENIDTQNKNNYDYIQHQIKDLNNKLQSLDNQLKNMEV